MQKALIIIGFLVLSFPSLAQDDQTKAQARNASASSWVSQLFNALSVAPSEIFISEPDNQDAQTEQDNSQNSGFSGNSPFSNTQRISF